MSSKLNVGREFLGWLFELGRSRAEAFLRDHFDKIAKDASTSRRMCLIYERHTFVDITSQLGVISFGYTRVPLGYYRCGVKPLWLRHDAILCHPTSI